MNRCARTTAPVVIMAILAFIAGGFAGNPATADTPTGPSVVNQPPTATPINLSDQYLGTHDLTATILAAATDPEGQPLSIVGVTTSTLPGTASVNYNAGSVVLEYRSPRAATINFTASVSDGVNRVDVPVTFSTQQSYELVFNIKQHITKRHLTARVMMVNKNTAPLKIKIKNGDYTSRKILKTVLPPGGSVKLVTKASLVSYTNELLAPSGSIYLAGGYMSFRT